MIIWFIGQPASGKTTLAKALMSHSETKFIHIDGDELRDIVGNKDYSTEGRKRNLQTIMDMAKFLHFNGHNVIISAVAPIKKYRDKLKNECAMKEVYLHTTQIRGRESRFAKRFELPTENYIDIDTTNVSIQDCINQLIMKKIFE